MHLLIISVEFFKRHIQFICLLKKMLFYFFIVKNQMNKETLVWSVRGGAIEVKLYA